MLGFILRCSGSTISSIINSLIDICPSLCMEMRWTWSTISRLDSRQSPHMRPDANRTADELLTKRKETRRQESVHFKWTVQHEGIF